MTSEVRRAAALLVSRRTERFTTSRSREDAQARVARAFEDWHGTRVFASPRWVESEGGAGPVLEVEFTPAGATGMQLKIGSALMMLLIAAAAWSVASPSATRFAAFFLCFGAMLAVFALPMVGAALGSQREGEEVRLRKAVRAALAEEPG